VTEARAFPRIRVGAELFDTEKGTAFMLNGNIELYVVAV